MLIIICSEAVVRSPVCEANCSEVRLEIFKEFICVGGIVLPFTPTSIKLMLIMHLNICRWLWIPTRRILFCNSIERCLRKKNYRKPVLVFVNYSFVFFLYLSLLRVFLSCYSQ